MSRRHVEESSFGSDSFLDVIANIVGILIILIVVAGVRVSQAPLLSIESEKLKVTEPETSASIELLPAGPIEGEFPVDAELFSEVQPESEQIVSAPDFVAPPDLNFPAIAQVVIPKELEEKTNTIKEQAAKSKERVSSLKKELAVLKSSKSKEQLKLDELKAQLSALSNSLQQKSQLSELHETDQLKSQQIIDLLEKRLEETSEKRPDPEKLAHRLNPVGRVVSGKEVHFRIHDNKISYVPVDLLAELVKRDMHRRRDFLMNQPRFQSTVGPISGYEMEFLVQRESGSLLEGARFGTGMIRISVTDWVIHPTRDVEAETFEEAIQPRSQFRSALISEGSNATITFWVYPESFELHRKLKELVQDSGFWVASRPLPEGYPIAGSSSSGSKSIAQ
ncbi:hypothetical protein [Thalassoglobus sp.]|uniref:hypothetical protein n=1 Tax=Thalassoglobus sp. TaxID=2795869 RepID=UPI003AA9385F